MTEWQTNRKLQKACYNPLEKGRIILTGKLCELC